MSLQLEINKRLYMDEATRTRNANFETPAAATAGSRRRGARLHDERAARAGGRTGERGRHWRRAPATVAAARPAQAQRRGLEDAGEHRQALTALRARATRSRSPNAAASRPRSRSTVAGCAARSQRRRRRAAVVETLRAALAGRNLACWCALNGPCHAEFAADARQSALSRRLLPGTLGSRQRERRGHPGAAGGVVLQRRAAVVEVDDLLDERQSESGALFFAVAGRASERTSRTPCPRRSPGFPARCRARRRQRSGHGRRSAMVP